MSSVPHSSGIGGRISRLVAKELGNLAGAVGERAVESLRGRVGGLTDRLTDFAERSESPKLVAAAKGAEQLAGGGSPTKAAAKGGIAGGLAKLKQAFGKGKKSKKLKLTNIVEFVDVGVPVRVAYNQWTEFEDIPRFTKKVEKVEREKEQEKVNWRAQIFLSHRDWESQIVEMVPDERIVWRSKGAKGYPDGAISFHALTPTLTRVVLIIEYHPKGFFEQTGNLWRAQGRRARLELKHFVRHCMTQAVLHPEELEGWRGVIHDGEVVLDHETAVEQEREREEAEEPGEGREREGREREEEEEEREEEEEEEEGREEEERGESRERRERRGRREDEEERERGNGRSRREGRRHGGDRDRDDRDRDDHERDRRDRGGRDRPESGNGRGRRDTGGEGPGSRPRNR
ncbi:SRPBCC family protein [Dactylosporangium roseum]|uniref:SRPBCC family protein n=1 Tax=Dactylosporangium roseum TaxID=47989 RepID=A0ABY5YW66_9ACTN|nr:SRPBCC family protein [Dactylosporangium roseum]UWZ33996.1 SRPBCC family protein [Dactylosporangium roseum]